MILFRLAALAALNKNHDYQKIKESLKQFS